MIWGQSALERCNRIMASRAAQGGDSRALDSPLSVALAVTVFALDFLLIGLRWFSLEYFFCYGCATAMT
jgi:hypothetical protein